MQRDADELRRRRRRPESAVRQLRVPVRSLVEPGRRRPGDQPGPSHRRRRPGHGHAVPHARTRSKSGSTRSSRRSASCSTRCSGRRTAPPKLGLSREEIFSLFNLRPTEASRRTRRDVPLPISTSPQSTLTNVPVAPARHLRASARRRRRSNYRGSVLGHLAFSRCAMTFVQLCASSHSLACWLLSDLRRCHSTRLRPVHSATTGRSPRFAAPTLCSALDMPLRPYFMPRRPAWGPHDYRYNVKEPEPCCCGGPGGCGPWCADGEGPCQQADARIRPKPLSAWIRWEFENLGQIPNDSLLEGVVAPRRTLVPAARRPLRCERSNR